MLTNNPNMPQVSERLAHMLQDELNSALAFQFSLHASHRELIIRYCGDVPTADAETKKFFSTPFPMVASGKDYIEQWFEEMKRPNVDTDDIVMLHPLVNLMKANPNDGPGREYIKLMLPGFENDPESFHSAISELKPLMLSLKELFEKKYIELIQKNKQVPLYTLHGRRSNLWLKACSNGTLQDITLTVLQVLLRQHPCIAL
jgi:hypothetical protein